MQSCFFPRGVSLTVADGITFDLSLGTFRGRTGSTVPSYAETGGGWQYYSLKGHQIVPQARNMHLQCMATSFETESLVWIQAIQQEKWQSTVLSKWQTETSSDAEHNRNKPNNWHSQEPFHIQLCHMSKQSWFLYWEEAHVTSVPFLSKK